MNDKITVQTKRGRVRGLRCTSEYSDKTFYSFLGIPYAEKPEGKLRFRNPRPKKRWDGVLETICEKDDCLQFSFYKSSVTGSEDCLYLNIHIPEIPSRRKQLKAVILMIHPGSFFWGSGSREQHGRPDYMIHHDIVYVTLNYRLHLFGFLNLGVNECPGNVALKDIVLALKWIQENIEQFGGDPNNVTLLGGSSAAVIAHCLMLSSSAKGLYHKVILMGMYLHHPFMLCEEDPISNGVRFAKSVGFQGEKAQDAATFLKQTNNFVLLAGIKTYYDWIGKEYKRIYPSSPFLPSVECSTKNAFFDRSPLDLLDSTNPVPIIFGICEKETIFTYKPSLQQVIARHFKTVYRQQPWNWLRKLNDETMAAIEKDVLKRYNENVPTDGQVNASIDAHTDLIAMEFYDKVANVIHKLSPQTPVYVYKFEYMGHQNDMTAAFLTQPSFKVFGTSHADDQNYFMGRNVNPTSEDRAMIETLTKLFTNFAKTGNPSEENDSIQWRASTLEKPCYLSIDRQLRLINKKLNNEGIKFWLDIKQKYSA